MSDKLLDTLKNMVNYLPESNFPRVLNNPKTKYRLFRSTKPKRDNEKIKRKKQIAKNSKKINRRK